MDNKCNHYVGYTLNTRSETFKKYFNDELVENLDTQNEIDTKFNYCPDCGEEIEWSDNYRR